MCCLLVYLLFLSVFSFWRSSFIGDIVMCCLRLCVFDVVCVVFMVLFE